VRRPNLGACHVRRSAARLCTLSSLVCALMVATSGCSGDASVGPTSFQGPLRLLPTPELATDLIRTTNVRVAQFTPGAAPSIVLTEVIPLLDDLDEGKADHSEPTGGSPSGGVVTILSNCAPYCDAVHLTDVAKLPVRTHVVDFDADYDMDILVSDLGVIATIDTDQGKIILLERDDAGAYHPTTLAEGLGRVACAEGADLDRDGDMDVVGCVFGHLKGELMWLEQTSPMSFEQHTLDPRAGYIHAFPLDLDGDGDLDIPAVISQVSEEVVLFRGDGVGGFEREVLFQATDPCYGMSGLEPVDFDLDGDIDLLVTNGDMFDNDCGTEDAATHHGLDLFTNDGQGNFERTRLVDFYAAYSVRAADFDQDGDMDFVLSSQQAPEYALPGKPNAIVWYEQKDGEFVPHPIEGGGYSAITLELFDADRDGRMDLLTGTMDIQSRSQGERLGLFLNTVE
jgi:hypothetical protein